MHRGMMVAALALLAGCPPSMSGQRPEGGPRLDLQKGEGRAEARAQEARAPDLARRDALGDSVAPKPIKNGWKADDCKSLPQPTVKGKIQVKAGDDLQAKINASTADYDEFVIEGDLTIASMVTLKSKRSYRGVSVGGKRPTILFTGSSGSTAIKLPPDATEIWVENLELRSADPDVVFFALSDGAGYSKIHFQGNHFENLKLAISITIPYDEVSIDCNRFKNLTAPGVIYADTGGTQKSLSFSHNTIEDASWGASFVGRFESSRVIGNRMSGLRCLGVRFWLHGAGEIGHDLVISDNVMFDWREGACGTDGRKGLRVLNTGAVNTLIADNHFLASARIGESPVFQEAIQADFASGAIKENRLGGPFESFLRCGTSGMDALQNQFYGVPTSGKSLEGGCDDLSNQLSPLSQMPPLPASGE